MGFTVTELDESTWGVFAELVERNNGDGLAQGWCQFGDPEELSNIKHRRRYDQEPPLLPDWRITCFYVDRRHRGEGIARLASARPSNCSSSTASSGCARSANMRGS